MSLPRFVSALVGLGALLSGANAMAWHGPITALPDLGTDCAPIVSDRYVAWTLGPQTYGSWDTQGVVLYDRSTASRVNLGSSSLLYTYTTVSAAKDNYVAWRCRRYNDPDHDIVLFDGTSLSLLTNDSIEDGSPFASASYLDWFSTVSTTTTWNRYNLSNHQTTACALPRASVMALAANDHWAAYTAGSLTTLYLYDGVQERSIAANAKTSAGLSEQYLAYTAGFGVSLGYVYNIATDNTVQIPQLGYVDQISVSGAYVVATGRRSGDGSNKTFLFDIAAGTLRCLSEQDRSASNPMIDGQHVVWQSEDGSTYKVSHYDLAAGTTEVLGQGLFAKISGNTVVWQGRAVSGSGTDIYMTTVPEPATWSLLLAAGAAGLAWFRVARRRSPQ